MGRSAVPGARRGHRTGASGTSIRVPAGAASSRARGWAPHGAATRRAAVELVGGPSFRGTAHRRAALGRDRPRPKRGRSRALTILVTAIIAFLIGILILVGSAVGLSAAAVAVLSQGLPDPTNLEALTFAQPTVVYDRTGTVELGRFQREQRRVVTFGEVPQLVLDATTTAEDRTFWTNGGFDPPAILAAAADNAPSGARERGASTITQQLVRARLLPPEVTAAGADRYLRKAKELIQSARLTAGLPGRGGQGADHHGLPQRDLLRPRRVRDRRRRPDLLRGHATSPKLTPAQAALLAGPAEVAVDLRPVPLRQAGREGPARRPGRLRRPSSAATTSSTSLVDARAGPSSRRPSSRRRSPSRSSSPATSRCRSRRPTSPGRSAASSSRSSAPRRVDRDRRLHGHHDARLAGPAARREVAHAPARSPRTSRAKARRALLRALKIGASATGPGSTPCAARTSTTGRSSRSTTGPATSSPTSAAPATTATTWRAASSRPSTTPPATASRQPGSAFKPILYASAFDTKRLTPGSLLLDIADAVRRADWTPRDADQLERGPVLVRKALQYSLNMPAIRALQRVGNEAVADRADEVRDPLRRRARSCSCRPGWPARSGRSRSRPLDLTSAYGAIANGGVRVPPRMILEIRDPTGKVVYAAPRSRRRPRPSARRPRSSSPTSSGNTDPRQNPIWSKVARAHATGRTASAGRPPSRPAPRTTPVTSRRTASSRRRRTRAHPALAVGLWMGNSDHSNPRSRKPAISLTAAAPLWHAFVRD